MNVDLSFFFFYWLLSFATMKLYSQSLQTTYNNAAFSQFGTIIIHNNNINNEKKERKLKNKKMNEINAYGVYIHLLLLCR
jgi:hypothetical protein